MDKPKVELTTGGVRIYGDQGDSIMLSVSQCVELVRGLNANVFPTRNGTYFEECNINCIYY